MNSKLELDFQALWSEADRIWDERQNEAAYHGYVSADYEAVLEALLARQGTATTFLEWGSGLGVVTIMASRLGFEAFGIESESELIDESERLAEIYGPSARFGHGSFVPDEFQWNPAAGEDLVRTVVDLPDAYEQIGMELRDFELIYAYPWPDEHIFYHNIIRQFGCRGAQLLSYDAREGIDLTTF